MSYILIVQLTNCALWLGRKTRGQPTRRGDSPPIFFSRKKPNTCPCLRAYRARDCRGKPQGLFRSNGIVGSSPTMTVRRNGARERGTPKSPTRSDGIPASSAGMTERRDAPKKKKSMLDGRGILLYINWDKSLPIKAAGNLSVC